MKVQGFLKLPGDKSLSHRALLLAALSRGHCRINNPNSGDDVLSTAKCLQACGIRLNHDHGKFLIDGGSLRNPSELLDCGNSGTTARLLSGFLCGQGIAATLVGDKSLSSRPMKRVVDPLMLMGGSLKSTAHKLPLEIYSSTLKGTFHELSVPSAQVKSCLLFAGLGAEGVTTVADPFATRDHTERMFEALGLPLTVRGAQISTSKLIRSIDGFEYDLPGDFSTAAFFIALTTILPDSDLIIYDVLLNQTRLGFLDVLNRMGANIQVLSEKIIFGERRGDLRIQGVRELQSFEISGDETVRLIDEVPLLSFLGAVSFGESKISGAGELRHKESDRLKAMSQNLKTLGVNLSESQDGLIIGGPTKLKSGLVSSFGDHRIAMTMLIAKIFCGQDIQIDDCACIKISCPEFISMLDSLIV